mmetsp:Transcript_68749/g.223871  ORF Transcript_68749/g.223871 Transcript_68749/m.223871 type:complete len:217 (-) Transcript_68749:302-952(-)
MPPARATQCPATASSRPSHALGPPKLAYSAWHGPPPNRQDLVVERASIALPARSARSARMAVDSCRLHAVRPKQTERLVPLGSVCHASCRGQARRSPRHLLGAFAAVAGPPGHAYSACDGPCPNHQDQVVERAASVMPARSARADRMAVGSCRLHAARPKQTELLVPLGSVCHAIFRAAKRCQARDACSADSGLVRAARKLRSHQRSSALPWFHPE